ncbi:hypothetical protein ACFW9D_05975 [Streptomyces sp. NPDC059524]|uniref:hypothetical protein n=1 Tax=Streptomyces sp. NPDC059524 TaxID=3346856 RepID=UPI0036A99B20
MIAHELLVRVLERTSTDYLDEQFGPDTSLAEIADHILFSRDEEVLNAAADDYEAATRERHPGAIYGAIRRIQAAKVGAMLRARALPRR